MDGFRIDRGRAESNDLPPGADAAELAARTGLGVDLRDEVRGVAVQVQGVRVERALGRDPGRRYGQPTVDGGVERQPEPINTPAVNVQVGAGAVRSGRPTWKSDESTAALLTQRVNRKFAVEGVDHGVVDWRAGLR